MAHLISVAKRRVDSVWDIIDPYVRGILAVLLAVALLLLVIFAWQAKDSATQAKITAEQAVQASANHHAETAAQNKILSQQQQEILANQEQALQLQHQVLFLQGLAGQQANEIKDLVNAHTGDIQQNSNLLAQLQGAVTEVTRIGNQVEVTLTQLTARVNAECLAVQKIQPTLQCQPIPAP